MTAYDKYKQKYKKTEQTEDGQQIAVAPSAQTSTKTSTGSYADYKKRYASAFATDFRSNLGQYQSEFKNFISNAITDSNNVSYGSAANMRASHADVATGLKSRAKKLMNSLEYNRSSMSDSDYQQARDFLRVAQTDVDDVMRFFDEKVNYFGQWENEAAYNSYLEQEKIKSMSDEDLQKMANRASITTQIQTLERNDMLGNVAMNVMGGSSGYYTSVKNPAVTSLQRQLAEQGGAVSNVAYTTADGQNVTWQQLLDNRTAEKDLAQRIEQYSKNSDWAVKSQGLGTEEETLRDYDVLYRISAGMASAEEQQYALDKYGVGDRVSAGQKAKELMGTTNEQSAFVGDLDVMTEDESAVFYYIKNTEGLDAAMQWHNGRKGIYEQRTATETAKAFYEIGKENPVLGSLASVGFSLGSGIEYVDDILHGREQHNTAAAVSAAIRQGVSEKAKWEIAGWDAGGFLYNTVMSGIDSLAATVTTGGFGGVVLGLSAAASATNNALERGLSSEQAFWTGLASGVFEGLFESVSIGKFKSLQDIPVSSFKDIARNIGSSMLVNASEETLTEIANVMYDTFANTDLSQFETAVRKYIATGMSEEEARKKVIGETVGQIVEAGASGALMGVGFGTLGSAGGVSAAVDNTRQTVDAGRGIITTEGGVDALKAQALSAAENMTSKEQKTLTRQANQVTGEVYEGKGLSKAIAGIKNIVNANRVGKLYNAVSNTEIKTELAQALSSKDIEASRAEAIAEAVVSQVSGKTLTGKQAATLEEARTDKRVEAAVEEYALRHNTEQSGAGEIDVAKSVVETTDGFTAGDTGETLYEGKAVSIEKIAPSKNGQMMLSLADGRTVPAKDVSYADEGTAQVYTAVASLGVDADIGNILVNNYINSDGSVSAEDYALGMTDAFRSGVNNLDISDNQYVVRLTDQQRNDAYLLGKHFGGKTTVSAEVKTMRARMGKLFQESGKWKQGSVTVKGLSSSEVRKALNDTQNKAYDILKFYAEATGINIVLYRSSAGADGKFQGAQGIYRTSEPGTIYIDLNAGLSSVKDANDLAKYTMLRTFAHEFTHFIENWNPVQYNTFKSFVLNALTQNGKNAEAMITQEQAADPSLSREAASREVVAEAMTDILPDARFMEALAMQHKTIFDKLLSRLKAFVMKLKQSMVYKRMGLNQAAEANALKKQVDGALHYMDSIVKQFDKIAVQAVENYQKAEQDKKPRTEQKQSRKDTIQEVNHNERREETRKAFIGRAVQTLPEVAERGALAFGYRRYSGQLSQNVQAAEEELKKIGIPVVVFEQMEGNRDGVTTIYRNDALALPGVAVFIHKGATVDALEIVGHEGYHYLAGTADRDVYNEVLAANVDFASKAFVDYQQKYVGDIYFAEDVEIGSKEWNTLIEEIFAYITGDIHNGDPKGEIYKFLRDYDTVKTAWESLIGKRNFINQVMNGENVNFQQRTEALTDRDILQQASEVLQAEELTDGERDALKIFRNRLAAVEEAGEQLTQQKKLLEKQKKDGSSPAEIQKTKNRIKIFEDKLERVNKALQSLEQMATIQKLANKARPAVEEKRLAAQKAKLAEYQAQYGTIPKGEKTVRDDSLPKSTDGTNRVSRVARTAKGAEVTPDAYADMIDAEVAEGGLSYIPITNDETTRKARAEIEALGWEDARIEWAADVRSGKTGAKMAATGALLLNNAAQAGDKKTWLSILYDYQAMGTNTAQGMQAFRILKQLQPEDKLYMVRRSILQMIKDMRLGVEIELDETLVNRYLTEQDEDLRDSVYDEIMQSVADQIPANWVDKWTAIRYLNMLGNFRTQVRNLAGNTIMGATVEAKNLIATSLEQIAYIASGGKFEKTKAVAVSKEMMDAAKADYRKVEDIISDGGKYNDQKSASTEFAKAVMKKRKIFKTKLLEKYRTGTSWAMDKGDVLFSKYAYARALAGYLKAHGITDSDFSNVDSTLMDEARLYAVQEAQEATFHDMNVLSKAVSKRYRGDNPAAKFASIAAEGVMPFRKTPANIAVRAEEYSPLGVVNSLFLTAQQALGKTKLTQKNNLMGDFARAGQEITGAQVVNSWAKSLTGSGIFFLGWMLAGMGHLIGGPDDDEALDEFEDLNGQQNYALKFGDWYVTIDWASPTAIPLFMGAQLYKLAQEDGIQAKDIEAALTSLVDPMIEMSMLQGINDTLENIQYSENNIMQLGINAMVSYLTQGLTSTLVGQLERSFEDSRMSTYVDKDSNLPDWMQRVLGKASAKIPGWDYNQIPYINSWGQEETNPGLLANMASNMLSPSYVSKEETDAVSQELTRLHEVNESGRGVFPSTPEKTATFTDSNGVKHKDYNLSAEEYVELAKAKGQTQRKIIESMVGSELYAGLPDQYKVKAVQTAYDYAREYAQIEVLDRDGFSSDWMAELDGDIADGVVKHIIKENIKGMYENGHITAEEAVKRCIAYCGDTAKEAAEKVAYWDFQQDNSDYADWTESAVINYHDYAKPAGIDLDTYAKYIEGKTGLETKEEICIVINGLDLTRKQKDALYLMNGWAKSKLDEARWNRGR